MSESPPLADLQDWLGWIFTEPRGVERALSSGAEIGSLSRRLEPQPRLARWINSSSSLDVRRRLSIYANAYFSRLLEALGSDYQAVRRALGGSLFRRLIADYLRKTPSVSRNISDIGEGLPDFLRGHGLNREFPFLRDLALLEWEVLRRLYTNRPPPLAPSSLKDASQAAWPRARLIADPTVALLDLEWPVDVLWRRRGEPLNQGQRRLSRPRRRRLLLWRGDGWVMMRPIGLSEFSALKMVLDGKSLGEICSEMAESSGVAAPDFKRLFSKWAALGLIQRIDFPGRNILAGSST